MEATREHGLASRGVRSRAHSGRSTSVSTHPRAALRDLLRALDAAGIAATPRAVATALWAHCDPCGRCWPSQTTLARLTGRCERTVRDAVKALEAAGVLLRDVPALRERRVCRRTTAYRFTVGAWLPVSARVPASSVEASHEPLSGSNVEAATSTRPEAVEAPPASAALDVEAEALHPVEAPHEPHEHTHPVEAVTAARGAAPSAATAAAPSAATTAERRSQRFKSPHVAPPQRPPVARCSPPAPRSWSLPALGAAVARLRCAVRSRE